MIRIDEVYNHTFWPFIERHLPHTRLFYCDPFGHTQPENLLNTRDSASDRNFIYCHDQEPVYPAVHHALFQDVARRNRDLNHGRGPTHGAIITSEHNSDSVTQVCSEYNWRAYYYFFHGWAALDWYRGYDRSWLITPAVDRRPAQVYFNPNRIIGGYRSHRLIMMYHLLNAGCDRGYWSMPEHCPDSGKSLVRLIEPLAQRYPGIEKVFAKASIPANLPGETGHPMHSCWLSQFAATADSMVYIVTETVAQGKRLHLTEKTFRPICLQMPFVLVGTRGSLAYLRSYGFRTFGDFWDESYDLEPDDDRRIALAAQVVIDLHAMSDAQRQQLWRRMLPVIEHNYQHFYRGEFEALLWQELQGMLQQIRTDFAS